MAYSNEEALQEILKRSETVRKKKERLGTRLLSAASGILASSLIIVIILLSGRSASGITNPAYGALLLPAEAGGYILVALIAFAAGVILTILIYRSRNNDNGRKERKKE